MASSRSLMNIKTGILPKVWCTRIGSKLIATLRFIQYSVCLSLMYIVLAGALCTRVVYAVEINLFNYGPSFTLELNPISNELNQQLRSDLITHRQSNTENAIYDTSLKFARAEKAILVKLLRASGYYQSTVEFSLINGSINYQVTPGPLYRLRKLNFSIPEDIEWPEGNDLGLHNGDPLNAKAVLDALEKFRKQLALHNCLLTIDVSYEALLFEEHALADIEFSVSPSLQVVFNDIFLKGLSSVDEAYLRRKIKIKREGCFSRIKLDNARLALLQSNLIAGVNQMISAPENGRVDITFELTERNHRTLKLGAGYSTDEQGIISFGWENRNLMEAGQKLTVDTRFSAVLQSLDSRLVFPEALRPDQTFEVYGQLAKEKRDSYKSERIIGGWVLTRKLSKTVSASGGVQLKLSKLEDEQGSEAYTLLSSPLTLSWNTTKDALDPREGWILTGQAIPYTDLFNVGTRFLKLIASGSTYLTQKNIYGEPTFAVRASLGALLGASLEQVPTDERYHSGGGGSVRGYAYQTLSQYQNGDPVGGLSFIEMSFEARLHHGEHWGTVLFSDGGFANVDTTPEWNETLRWSAGVGIRYFTAALPIRFDIAWPLHARKDIDDSFKLYISLGQSF
jgi:translocation and assembly module TamA